MSKCSVVRIVLPAKLDISETGHQGVKVQNLKILVPDGAGTSRIVDGCTRYSLLSFVLVYSRSNVFLYTMTYVPVVMYDVMCIVLQTRGYHIIPKKKKKKKKKKKILCACE
jgi:hypothetical protein